MRFTSVILSNFKLNFLKKKLKFKDEFSFLVMTVVVLAEAAEKKCSMDCGSDYKPLCGKVGNIFDKTLNYYYFFQPADGKGTDITFGSNCVLEKYNCEKSDKRKYNLLLYNFLFVQLANFIIKDILGNSKKLFLTFK